MSYLDDYRKQCGNDFSDNPSFEQGHSYLRDFADDAIAELERDYQLLLDHDDDQNKKYACEVRRVVKLETTIERLKCCGNCAEWRPEGGRCYMGNDGTVFTNRMDHCHFTSSRWAETAFS